MSVTIAILEFVFLIVPWIATIGWLSARVLGIHLGPWRASFVATLGWVGGLAVTGIVHDHDPGIALGVLTTVFFGVMIAMPLAVTLDLLTRRGTDAPVGRRRLRTVVVHPVRAGREMLAPWGRMREVVRDARRRNLVHVRYRTEEALDSPDFARRIRELLEETGGMMVKFGQIASTRTDLLPEPLTTELAHLRSDVRPIPPDDVRGALEAGLGEPIANTFAEFEWEPLAAASIGQTHRARLITGESVVVKVQRPGVSELVARDAAVLRLVARQLDRRVDAAHRVGITRLA
ncbi:MAG: AarF/ABC1/UbiB kinase family protein, partial [Acidimicrobiia bacterium]|nr:AarF/ABC1/UbiB kinase family protein [Acidimicrobiia bacterium]